MAGYLSRHPAASVRRIVVKFHSGDIAVRRIEGAEVVISADEHLDVSLEGETLIIGAAVHALPGLKGLQAARGGLPIDDGEFPFTNFLGASLSHLGTQIGEAVASAVQSFAHVASAQVQIGIPAIVEHPLITLSSTTGDIECSGVTADWLLHTGLGDITLREAGGALRAQTAKGDVTVTDFTGQATCTTGAGDLQAQRVEGRLDLRSGSGDVRVESCTGGGEIQSGAGDLTAQDVHGNWRLRTGRGDTRVHVARGGSLEIVTGSGDVAIEGGALTHLHVHTASGDVRCASLLLGERHELVSGHGDLALMLANPPGARLQILTGHGEVGSDFPLVRVGKQGPPSACGMRYVGNVGDSSIDIVLRTGTGDVRVRRAQQDAFAPVDRTAAAEQAAGSIPPVRGHQGAGEPVWPHSATAPVSSERPETAVMPAAALPPVAGEQASETAEARLSPQARLRILQSLQRGDITVQEASALLESLPAGPAPA